MKNNGMCLGTMLALMMIVSCIGTPMMGALIGGTGSRALGADVTVVSVVKVVPVFAKAGDNVTFNATIKNVGDKNATNVTITVSANTTTGSPMDLGTFLLGHDNGMQNLTPAPTSTPYYLAFYWNTSKPGLGVQDGLIYTVTVTASNKTDANMTNNSAKFEFTFAPADKKWPYVNNLTVAPSEVITGDNVMINGTFKDSGQLPAPAEPVFFYLDYNWTGNNTDIFNTTVDILDYYDLGDGVSAVFEWNTTGTALGNHSITAIVPSTGSNMTTNFTIKPVPPPPGHSDLTILDLGLNKTMVLQGLPLNLSITVKNVGNNASVATQINITDTMSTFNMSIDIPAMDPAEEKVFYAVIDSSKLSVALHNLQVWVDRPDINDEWNETNNTKYITFTVTSKPDLALSNMKFYEGGSWTTTNETYQGSVVKLAVTVKNLGFNSSKNATKLAFYLDDLNTQIGNKSLMPASPGANIEPTFEWNTSSASVGVHTILAVVDPDNKNDELNETNNQASAVLKILEVIKPSDLTIESMSLSATTISPGDKMTISLVVANKGAGPAQNIDLDATLESSGGVVLKSINHTVLPYMGADSKQYVNLLWFFFENLAPGDYVVKVALDKDNKIKELKENNNENKTNIKVVDKVILKTDPMISAIVADPANPTQDKKVIVTVSIINKGNRDSRDLVITLFQDDKKVDDIPVAVLAKNNATLSLVFNVTFKTDGKHHLNATLLEGGVQKFFLSKDVTVKEKKENTFTGTNTVLLILALLLLVAIAVVLIAGGKKRPSEYEDKDDVEEDEEEEEEAAVAGGEEE